MSSGSRKWKNLEIYYSEAQIGSAVEFEERMKLITKFENDARHRSNN